MITETTAISVIAFLALVTALGIAAGLGWMRCARMLKIARDASAHWKQSHDRAKAKLEEAWGAVRGAQDAASYYSRKWREEEAAHNRDLERLIDTEDQLRKIEQTRHNAAKIARAAQLAQQSAAKEARRLELEQNIADRAEPVREAA